MDKLRNREGMKYFLKISIGALTTSFSLPVVTTVVQPQRNHPQKKIVTHGWKNGNKSEETPKLLFR